MTFKSIQNIKKTIIIALQMSEVYKKTLPLRRVLLLLDQTRFRSTSTAIPFKIPAPIERSSTDILEALAKNTGSDKTGPQWTGLYDDPLTFGISSQRRKEYFLCREYGKRAARKLVEEWPTLFMFDRDQPRLQAFRPTKPANASIIRADQKNLVKAISDKQVEQAAILYERICEAGKPIAASVQLNLFRLLAYYNAQNVPENEQEWPGLRVYYETAEKKRQEGGAVDLLFESLKKTAKVYSIMICHLCKHPVGDKGTDSLVRAKELLSEMLLQSLTPTEEVFSWLLLRKVSTTNEAFNIYDLFSLMKNLKVKPSLTTFNNAIACLKDSNIDDKWTLAKAIMYQMSKCGIRPTLTTYDLLISSVAYRPTKDAKPEYKSLQCAVNLLDEILSKLEKAKDISFRERSDRNFFIGAFFVAKKARNHSLADRLEKIYSNAKNEVKMSPFGMEALFYNEYFIFSTQNSALSMEQLYQIYIRIVPAITSIGKFSIFVLKLIESDPHWPFTKRLIEDGILTGLVSAEECVLSWQETLANYPTETLIKDEMVEFKKLVQKLVDIWSEVNQDKKLNIIGATNRMEIPLENFVRNFSFVKYSPPLLTNSSF